LGASVRLQVAGLVNAGSVLALDGDTLELLGTVTDLSPLADAAIAMVVPTRFAAGIPHKAHQAAALGLPMVATRLIAKQLHWQPGRDLLVGDDAESFAAGCIRLSREAELWSNIRSSALDRCTEDCDPGTFRATVGSLLASLPKRVTSP
jgi:glycosyltransferase involved in cell wall biosynthesis